MAEESSLIPEIQYEDEVLPIIEIREIVDIEHVLKHDPHFVQYSYDQLLVMAIELMKEKGPIFHRQLIDFLEKRKQEYHATNILPILQADRDESEIETFLDNIVHAEQAPHYLVQQDEKEKATYPLQKIPPETPEQGIPNTDLQKLLLGLHGTVMDQIVLRQPDLRVAQTVVDRKYIVPTRTSSSYVTEYQYGNPIKIQDIEPNLEQALLEINHRLTPHEFGQHLERYGLSLDELDLKQLEQVIEFLKKPSKEIEEEELKKDEPMIHRFMEDTNLSDTLDRIKKEVRLIFQTERYNEMAQGHALQQEPMSPPMVEIPRTLYEIAQGIRTNQFTMEEVIQGLKYKRREWISQQIMNAIQEYTISMSIPADFDLQVLKEWEKLVTPYDKDFIYSFMDLYKDMAEVKEGNDSSTYEGIPTEDIPTYVQPSETVMPTILEGENEDEDEFVIEEAMDIGSSRRPFTIHGSPGVREVLGKVLRTIQLIQEQTDLPLDYELLQRMFVQHIHSQSRYDLLLELGLSLDHPALQPLSEEGVDIRSFIDAGVLGDDGPRIKQALDRHSDHVKTLQRSLMTEMLLWWIMEIQDACMDGRYQFRYEKGMMECFGTWAMDGFPITSNTKGVMNYILCINDLLYPAFEQMQDIIKMSSVDLEKSFQSVLKKSQNMSIIRKQLFEKAEQLQKKWIQYGKKAVRYDKVFKTIRDKVIDKMESGESYGSDFAKVVQMLPMILERPKITGRFGIGCCFQKLGSNYQANTDWKSISKRLWAAKNKLSAQRITKSPRPKLVLLTSKVLSELRQTESITVTTPPLYMIPVEERKTVGETLQEWRQIVLELCPPNLIDTYLTQPVGVIQQQRAGYMRWILQKVSSIANPFESVAEDNWNLSVHDTIMFLVELVKYYNKAWKVTQEVVNQEVVQKIQRMIQSLRQLQNVILTSKDTILPELLFIICLHAIALPMRPEGNTYVWNGEMEYANRMIKENAKTWNDFVKARRFPSIETQQKFITEQRERGKKETIATLEALDLRTRQLVQSLRKTGMRERVDTMVDQYIEGDLVQDQIEEKEGFGEFLYLAQDPDEFEPEEDV
jgi:hypothetical protein